MSPAAADLNGPLIPGLASPSFPQLDIPPPDSAPVKRTVPRLHGPAKTVAKGELVGLGATVHDSPDEGIKGLSGDVVGETLHTLTLRVGGPGGRRIQLAKAACVFAFEVPGRDEPVLVEGRAIEFRPQDRTKKVK